MIKNSGIQHSSRSASSPPCGDRRGSRGAAAILYHLDNVLTWGSTNRWPGKRWLQEGGMWPDSKYPSYTLTLTGHSGKHPDTLLTLIRSHTSLISNAITHFLYISHWVKSLWNRLEAWRPAIQIPIWTHSTEWKCTNVHVKNMFDIPVFHANSIIFILWFYAHLHHFVHLKYGYFTPKN